MSSLSSLDDASSGAGEELSIARSGRGLRGDAAVRHRQFQVSMEVKRWQDSVMHLSAVATGKDEALHWERERNAQLGLEIEEAENALAARDLELNALELERDDAKKQAAELQSELQEVLETCSGMESRVLRLEHTRQQAEEELLRARQVAEALKNSEGKRCSQNRQFSEALRAQLHELQRDVEEARADRKDALLLVHSLDTANRELALNAKREVERSVYLQDEVDRLARVCHQHQKMQAQMHQQIQSQKVLIETLDARGGDTSTEPNDVKTERFAKCESDDRALLRQKLVECLGQYSQACIRQEHLVMFVEEAFVILSEIAALLAAAKEELRQNLTHHNDTSRLYELLDQKQRDLEYALDKQLLYSTALDAANDSLRLAREREEEVEQLRCKLTREVCDAKASASEASPEMEVEKRDASRVCAKAASCSKGGCESAQMLHRQFKAQTEQREMRLTEAQDVLEELSQTLQGRLQQVEGQETAKTDTDPVSTELCPEEGCRQKFEDEQECPAANLADAGNGANRPGAPPERPIPATPSARLPWTPPSRRPPTPTVSPILEQDVRVLAGETSSGQSSNATSNALSVPTGADKLSHNCAPSIEDHAFAEEPTHAAQIGEIRHGDKVQRMTLSACRGEEARSLRQQLSELQLASAQPASIISVCSGSCAHACSLREQVEDLQVKLVDAVEARVMAERQADDRRVDLNQSWERDLDRELKLLEEGERRLVLMEEALYLVEHEVELLLDERRDLRCRVQEAKACAEPDRPPRAQESPADHSSIAEEIVGGAVCDGFCDQAAILRDKFLKAQCEIDRLQALVQDEKAARETEMEERKRQSAHGEKLEHRLALLSRGEHDTSRDDECDGTCQTAQDLQRQLLVAAARSDDAELENEVLQRKLDLCQNEILAIRTKFQIPANFFSSDDE